MNLNRSAIKANARNFIDTDRRWLYMAFACLPLTLVEYGLNGGTQIIQRFSDDGFLNFSVSFSSIITWLLIPFSIAMAGYYLNQIRGNVPDWKSLYREGIDNFVPYLLVGVTTKIFIALWSLLFVIPGIVKSLEWFFVNYIVHDNPNIDHKQARDLSKRMTEGFKWELFVLGLSFILWYMLIGVTFGLASFYVIPYIQCAQAMYYEDLKHNAIMSGVAAPEEFGITPVMNADDMQFNAQTSYEPTETYSSPSYPQADVYTPVEYTDVTDEAELTEEFNEQKEIDE